MKFNLTYKKGAAVFLFLFFAFVVIFLWVEIKESLEKEKFETENKLSDFARIKKTGILKAAVDYNSTNYFIYRGKPMGFQYELLQALSKDLEVNLEIVVYNSISESFNGLLDNRYDVIAQNLTITGKRSKQIEFTVPLQQTQQVLVQREKSGKIGKAGYINSVLELENKRVYVQKNSAYHQRLLNLSEEIGGHIAIVTDSVHSTEELIARVAKGEIDYTICDENIGKLNKYYYPNLDISLQVSLPQNIAWAVRKGSVEWKAFLDKWLTDMKETRKFNFLYFKYFESPRVAERMTSEFNSISGSRISKYDGIIKEVSKEYNWDWRLISAIVYHESRFNEDAGSWLGAYGLMQLMPATAEAFGIENIENPKQNVKGGVLLLNSLNNQFLKSIPDSTQRIKFVLAAYNIGLGHVNDAQRLAKKYGKNPNIWDDNVDVYLQNKSDEQYFKDEVVRFGYCRGEEATNFVRNVINNYKQYKNVIDY
ncbi:MAG TPA: transporter substrate-binding domain-containing protein [Draconibacterium sp.]|nr:transporter substrate-binding domain-containing protein [Draconibacterium sp.]